MALVLAVTPAAPVPKGQTPAAYFPTATGTKWVYQVTAVANNLPKRVSEVTEVIVRVEEKDGGVVVHVARGSRPPTWEKLVSAEGVFMSRREEGEYDPPLPLIRLERGAVAKKWEWDSAAPGGPGGRLTGECRGFDPEEVQVPAGRFRAIRVECVYTTGGGGLPWEDTNWYAPGVGRVKGTQKSLGYQLETVLKSFSAGKR